MYGAVRILHAADLRSHPENWSAEAGSAQDKDVADGLLRHPKAARKRLCVSAALLLGDDDRALFRAQPCFRRGCGRVRFLVCVISIHFLPIPQSENGNAKVIHGSGGIVLLRAE